MTLRPPNFSLLPSQGPSQHHNTAATANNHDNNRPSLSSYTNKCQKQLLLAVSRSIDDGCSDNDDETLTTKDDNGAKNNTNNKGSNKNNNREGSSNEPSMEQCILLLESHLAGFQKSCRQKKGDTLQRHSTDLEGTKKTKKRKKSYSASEQQQQPHASLNNSSNENEQNIDEEDDDDEVPPQLLRLARFFHYRWLPIKRALLRPIQHSNNTTTPSSSNEENQSTSPLVEVGLKYRLRLAKACWKHGLVAAAEYEMLIASLNKDSSNTNNTVNAGMKRKSHNDTVVGCEEDNLMERVRLALLRLPTDATITSSTVSTTTSSTSQAASATAAWRHVKEMILECCRYWEKNDITVSMLLPSSASVVGDDSERSNELISKHGISDVVDWALTSWTALLLSQGVDSFTATSSSTLTISNSNDPISKIEKEFATMLSNRSHNIGNNNDPNPFLLFAMAASNRINEILTYRHLKQMRGIHVLSLARLLAMFYSRDNAEEHIITSIITCSAVKGGGGMDCADSLSRLLAVYCCNISIADGDATPADSLVGKTANRTTAADLERRLRGKLNDEEFVTRVVSSVQEEDGQELKQRGMVLSTAKSFMDVIFSMTAHFIKCGGRN